jgi:hypothetical protein
MIPRSWRPIAVPAAVRPGGRAVPIGLSTLLERRIGIETRRMDDRTMNDGTMYERLATDRWAADRSANDASAFVDDELVDPLPESECLRLLATHTFGRVGVTSGALPVILPVRYLYSDGVVTFRSGGGTKLRAAANGDVLAFEIDTYDGETREGWSVLVLGRAVVLTTEHEHGGVPTLDPERPAEPRNHYVCMRCELVTGRRLVPFRTPAG